VKADDVRHGIVMVYDLPVSEVFPYSRFDPEKAVHLVVFPWAGASALSCLRLCSVVGEAVGVLAVEMAGRGTRSDEPTVQTVEEVAAEVTSALVDITDASALVIMAGHSLGAALAYETASQMSVAGLTPAINLSGKSNDFVKLKRYDAFAEVGLGCDFYLPFFKIRPELKFMYSLLNSLDTKHIERMEDKAMLPYARSVSETHSKMIVLTFYFE